MFNEYGFLASTVCFLVGGSELCPAVLQSHAIAEQRESVNQGAMVRVKWM
jgi:hypothetical protein